MSDIFVSYTSADRPRVKPLVDALQLQGWSVWWDRTILPGKTWDQVIEAALADARCVIVLWSRDSIQSDWVRTEADEAKRRGILVPVLLDDVNIPLAFKRIQAGNLAGWSGALPSAAFDELARAVSEVLSRSAPLAPEATTRPASAAPAPAAAAPEGRGIERGAASHKAGEVEAKQEFHPTAVAQIGGPPLFDVRAPSMPWKRVIIFGLAGVALLVGIVIYTQTGKEPIKTSSPAENPGATALPPISTTPLAPGQKRENPKDGLTYKAPIRTSSPAENPAAAASSPIAATPRAPGQKQVNPKDGLTYVWIPPGRFTMGCSQGDSECQPIEKPSHPVVISKGFWMGQTEVTQDAYQRVMGQDPSFFKGAQRPVESVNWNEASEYCGKVALRLPTEAEWEYAARAGTGGARYGDLDKVAWYKGNSGAETKPVRSLQPNPWGLYDMLGNVREWTGDWYGEEYYAAGETTDPVGPPSGQHHVSRGGSWAYLPLGVRVSYRVGDEPTNRLDDFGFRCAGELR